MQHLRAKVTKAFSGVKDGDVYATDFNVGDEVSGSLANEVINAGWAEPIGKPIEAKALNAAPENKSRKKTFSQTIKSLINLQ